MDAEAELIAEVFTVERNWVAAHRTIDIDVLSSILAENYRQIQTDGSVIGREELLQSYKSGDRSWETAQATDYEVRILGDTALLIGKWKGIGENSGEKFDYSARFLAVYQKVDQDWQLVSDVSIPINQ
jgi:ketosteroid isomerase-like protein